MSLDSNTKRRYDETNTNTNVHRSNTPNTQIQQPQLNAHAPNDQSPSNFIFVPFDDQTSDNSVSTKRLREANTLAKNMSMDEFCSILFPTPTPTPTLTLTPIPTHNPTNSFLSHQSDAIISLFSLSLSPFRSTLPVTMSPTTTSTTPTSTIPNIYPLPPISTRSFNVDLIPDIWKKKFGHNTCVSEPYPFKCRQNEVDYMKLFYPNSHIYQNLTVETLNDAYMFVVKFFEADAKSHPEDPDIDNFLVLDMPFHFGSTERVIMHKVIRKIHNVSDYRNFPLTPWTNKLSRLEEFLNK